jgi:epoxide hydrolase-like predicted phosphatase
MSCSVIKVIIFDFFGVIRQDAFHVWMNNHGYTRDDAPGDVSRRMDIGEIDGEQFCTELAQISGQTVEEVKYEFSENERFDYKVIEYVNELGKKYPLVLLSNSESSYLRNILIKKDLEKLFEVILISGEIGVAKPDREMFEMALSKLGVAPEEAVFIDDQKKNIDAAEKIGIRGIRFEDIDTLRKAMDKIL